MITTLFFILLLAYLIAGGDAKEVLGLGCLWLVLCFIGDVIMIAMFFGIFGMFFL